MSVRWAKGTAAKTVALVDDGDALKCPQCERRFEIEQFLICPWCKKYPPRMPERYVDGETVRILCECGFDAEDPTSVHTMVLVCLECNHRWVKQFDGLWAVEKLAEGSDSEPLVEND